ncbi:hypothetical protein MVEG_01437 [Podila verticillata NRRL 6337]|nr:hypothetical protein MVEG_01437 [Podila verticillata NRRL 6337]
MSLPTPSLIKASGPLETPEILGLLARYLSVNDLARCAQVSRLWNTVFRPQMWHTFDDSIEPWNAILEIASRTSSDICAFIWSGFYGSPADNRGRDEAWVRSVIGQNAKYIRRLTVKWALTLEACIQSGECTNITTFKTSVLPSSNMFHEVPPFASSWEQWVPDIPASFFVTENNPEGTLQDWYHPFIARALRFMWQFILQNSGLEELVLYPIQSTDYLSYLPPKPFLYNVLWSLTQLRRLEGLPLDNDDFVLLRTLMPNLEEFSPGRCTLDNIEYYGESVTEKGIEALKDTNTKMRIIKFQTSISARSQAMILDYMPGLRELHVGREFPGEQISPNENIHINADSVRLWSVPHLYCFLHPSITHSAKNLQELRIQMLNYGVNGLVELLRCVNPDLQVLDTDCFVDYPIGEWYREVALPLPPVLNIQDTLPQFNLRSLRLSGLSSPHVMFAPARQRGEEIAEQSEELTAGSAWWACFSNLTEFVTQFVAPATLIAIADNCPQIEILDVSLAQKGSTAIAYVLTKCSKLKSFIGKGHMIDVTHVVQGPAWVCRDIERLHIEIDSSTPWWDLIGRSKGRLRNWTMFTRSLRIRSSCPSHLGLGRLAGLKKLGCIGVQEMDLCVGQEEVDWMKKHWQLESWVGLSPFSAGGGFYSAKNGLIAKLIKEAWPSIRLH